MSEQGRPLTDTALRQVLETEREARQRIAEEETRAAAAVESARAEARQIEADAVAAARRFQTDCADKAATRVAHLRESAEQRLAQIESESGLPRIEAVAEALARELVATGSDDKPAECDDLETKGQA